MLSKAKIKYIRSLQLKKFRQKYKSYLAEGPKIVDELLTSNCNFQTIIATEHWFVQNSTKINGKNCETITVSEKDLGKISLLPSPQDVFAIINMEGEEEISIPAKGLNLVLESINDPGNLGTIIRTADWFGLGSIYCSPDCVDVFNPKVVQSSMGSVARVKVFYPESLLTLIESVQIKSYAATLTGTPLSVCKADKDSLIIIGNESKGISKNLLDLCSQEVSIIGYGKAESLNAAIACGILLYQFRQLIR